MERIFHETELAVERLTEEVEELKRRVQALEGRSAPSPGQPAPPVSESASSLSAGFIPLLGRAVLGIAGAYLLRAAAESGTLPGAIAAGAAAVYAVVWLILSRGRTGLVYSATAAIILFPMLWETTVRFKLLPPPAAAGILIAFVLLGWVLARSRNLAVLVWMTTLPAVVTAMLLMVATGDLVPFVTAVLAICVAVEGAAVLNQWAALRPWVALVADTAVGLMLYVAALPQQPEAYRRVTPAGALAGGLALLAIYAGSAGFRTVRLRCRITVFEIAQMTAAFVLAIGGALQLARGEHVPALGAFCLISAGACYAAAFGRFNSRDSARNHHVYASFGLALALAGSLLILSGFRAPLAWSALAALPGYMASKTKWSRLAPAGLAALIVVSFALTLVPAGSWLPAARTLILCASALLMGLSGARWKRAELVWIGYAVTALATLKLFIEDFRASSPAALAVALLCYGAVLIVMPRRAQSQ